VGGKGILNFWLHFGGHIFGDNNSKCMDYTHFFNIILIPVITNSLFYPPPHCGSLPQTGSSNPPRRLEKLDVEAVRELPSLLGADLTILLLFPKRSLLTFSPPAFYCNTTTTVKLQLEHSFTMQSTFDFKSSSSSRISTTSPQRHSWV